MIFFILTVTGCKTVSIKEKQELKANVMYKKLIKDSEGINTIDASGSIMIVGNKEIPAVYIKFETAADLKRNRSVFKLSVLSKPLIDLYMSDEKITLYNHTHKQQIALDTASVDFSRIIGINFDPAEIAYLLVGKIPYSENMQLVNLEADKNKALMNITNETTNFFIEFDRDGKISSIRLENQFFDKLIVDIISYDETNGDVPQKVKVSSEDKKVTITFLIRNIEINKKTDGEFTLPADGYEIVENIEDIKIKIK